MGVTLIESVPNVSEGQRLEVLETLTHTVSMVAGVSVLDVSADVAHNRSVFTLVGSANDLHRAILALFEIAVSRIDLQNHRGVHPRMGAVDVVPFIPFDDMKMPECVALARETAAA